MRGGWMRYLNTTRIDRYKDCILCIGRPIFECCLLLTQLPMAAPILRMCCCCCCKTRSVLTQLPMAAPILMMCCCCCKT